MHDYKNERWGVTDGRNSTESFAVTGCKYKKYNRVGGDEKNHEDVRINCERTKDTNYKKRPASNE